MRIDLNEIVHKIFRQQTMPVCQKFNEASKIFCETLSDDRQIELIQKSTEGLLFKQSLSIINLELLWEISDKKPVGITTEPLEIKEWNNRNSIIDSTFFENAIIQIRAFMDFAMKLAATSIGILKPIDNTQDFYKKIKRVEGKKSEEISEMFVKMDKTWGNNIRSIRDKILHYDIIKTNHSFRPTIQGIEYEKFVQKYDNHVFEFLVEMCEKVFQVKWVSGTFEEFKLKHNR